MCSKDVRNTSHAVTCIAVRAKVDVGAYHSTQREDTQTHMISCKLPVYGGE